MTRRRSPRPAPQPLQHVMADLVRRRRWSRRLEGARVHAVWESIAGAEVAAHARPVRLVGGVLVIAVTEPGWGTQLSYLTGDLAARANQVLGDGTVTTVKIISDSGNPASTQQPP